MLFNTSHPPLSTLYAYTVTAYKVTEVGGCHKAQGDHERAIRSCDTGVLTMARVECRKAKGMVQKCLLIKRTPS